jgi:hypothetical protein
MYEYYRIIFNMLFVENKTQTNTIEHVMYIQFFTCHSIVIVAVNMQGLDYDFQLYQYVFAKLSDDHAKSIDVTAKHVHVFISLLYFYFVDLFMNLCA